MTDELIEFLLIKKPKKYACSGWVVPSHVSLNILPSDLDNMPKVLGLLLKHGMIIKCTDIMNFIQNGPLHLNSIICLLNHCSSQQRVQLFEAVVNSKAPLLDPERKCDILMEILSSGDIEVYKFQPMFMKLQHLPQCQSKCRIQEKLIELGLLSKCKSCSTQCMHK